MRLRAMIFDDYPPMRHVLWRLCESRGYEVFTFPHPGVCPLHFMTRCPCPSGTVCADILLSDLQKPEVQGLDFIERLLARGCVAPHVALMSAAWSDVAHAHALRLGCRLFRKPFAIPDLLGWFDTVEAQVAPTRTLLDWRGQGWQIEPQARGKRL